MPLTRAVVGLASVPPAKKESKATEDNFYFVEPVMLTCQVEGSSMIPISQGYNPNIPIENGFQKMR